MIIRSQNKQNIFSINAISGIGFGEYCDASYPCQMYVLVDGIEYLLGKYSIKDKAIKALDLIQNNYQYCEECKYIGIGASQPEFVFQMPEDNDERLL